MNKKIFILLIFLILGLNFGLRLYKLDNPVAEWHSWRQADTAAVARNFLRFGFDPLRPRYDDLSNIQSGKDNPLGYRMVEFPLYQWISAGLAKTFPNITLEVWLRLVNITASTFTALFIIFLVSQTISQQTGLMTGLMYAILPYNVFYNRAILPETFGVFWAVLSLWLISQRKSWLSVILGGSAGAIALLVKPTTAFLLLPVFYILFKKYGFISSLIHTFIYAMICLLPLVAWRYWILQFPEGIPAYVWLLNSGNIRFKGAWFNWLFAERIGKLILGYWGLIPLGLGWLVKPEKKEGAVFFWWLVGALLYLVVFASGNVQHDYYQILLIPVISVYLGKGLAFLLNNRFFSKLACWLLATSCFLFLFAFSWFTIRTYYWANRQDLLETGRIADKLLPKEAKVIAPNNGDTTFLYHVNRQGWPLGFEIDKKIAMGATHYVTVSPFDTDTETRDLAKQYKVLVRNDKYAIIDLTGKK